MRTLQEAMVTVQVAIELADDALETAAQAKQGLQTARERIQRISTASLERYPLL